MNILSGFSKRKRQAVSQWANNLRYVSYDINFKIAYERKDRTNGID